MQGSPVGRSIGEGRWRICVKTGVLTQIVVRAARLPGLREGGVGGRGRCSPLADRAIPPPGLGPPGQRAAFTSGLATRVRQAGRNQAGRGPTEPCPGCNRFLLTSGREWRREYRVALRRGLIPNMTGIPCQPMVACPFTSATFTDQTALRTCCGKSPANLVSLESLRNGTLPVLPEA